MRPTFYWKYVQRHSFLSMLILLDINFTHLCCKLEGQELIQGGISSAEKAKGISHAPQISGAGASHPIFWGQNICFHCRIHCSLLVRSNVAFSLLFQESVFSLTTVFNNELLSLKKCKFKRIIYYEQVRFIPRM